MGLAFLKKTEAKFSRWILHSGVALALIAGLIQYIIRLNNAKKMNLALIKFNRQLILVIAAVAVLTFAFLILRLLFKKTDKRPYDYPVSALVALTLFFAFFYLSPIAYKMTGEFVYFGEDTLSTMSFLRAIGFVLGILIGMVCLFLIVKVSEFLNKRQVLFFLCLSSFVFAVDYLLRSVSAMQRMNLIPLSDLVFSIMIFGDRHGKFLIYGMLLVAFLMLAYVFLQNLKVSGSFENNALFRKAKSYARSARRYAGALLSVMVGAVLILTVLHYYSTKEVELTPPQEYTLENGKIIIPLTDVDDGHLHRFSYKTENGYDVRFIAVKKLTGNAYGLGLDACEICGVAGYYERGDEVICKRCDVVMNKNTIGFKGGCNPIPFPYEIIDKKIIIDVQDLIREEKRFK